MLHPRSSFIWYLLALLIPWVIKCVSLPITKQLGWEVLSDPGRVDGVANVLMLVTISILYEVFYAGGLNEEVGWTGFAMPRLQGCFSPLLASMILWFFWILWHIPFQLAGYWNPEMGDFIRSLVGSFFARFIFTWLFNKTRGGILSAILFHASANVSFMFLPATPVHMVLDAVIAVALIIYGRMWKKSPSDHPGVYES